MIRSVRKEEYDILIDIWKEAVLSTHDFLSDEDFKEILSQMPMYLDAVQLFGYDENGITQGFIGVESGNIEMLFVRKRGVGIGKDLLTYAIKEHGANKIDVNEQSTSALDFYRRQGFEVISRSEKDSGGRNYPILHMELKKEH